MARSGHAIMRAADELVKVLLIGTAITAGIGLTALIAVIVLRVRSSARDRAAVSRARVPEVPPAGLREIPVRSIRVLPAARPTIERPELADREVMPR